MRTKPTAFMAFFIFVMAPIAIAYEPGADDIVAVTGRASPDYLRVRQKDGTYAPETYSFGKGGYWSGPMNDATIDKMDFMAIAHTIAGPLANQHYVPSMEPKTTKLLIMVYWGTTYAPEHASDSPEYQLLQDAMANSPPPKNGNDPIAGILAAALAENRMRDNVNRRNAMLLGYNSWWEKTYDAPHGSALEVQKSDMISELEEDRYFVVLMAYDFQTLCRTRKHRLLWETRFSIRQQHHQFDKELPSLAQYASRYFGQDSHGLVRDNVPIGQVEVGEVKSFGEVRAR